MSDDAIRHRAEEIVLLWKLSLGEKEPQNYHITNQDELIGLIDTALREQRSIGVGIGRGEGKET